MKHLGISGGGTKIAGLYGAAEEIMVNKGYQPDIISGISAGAILALPLALGKHKEIKKLVLSFTMDTFFSESPVKDNGDINIKQAAAKIVQKKHFLGKQENLKKVLNKIVTKKEFDAYTKDKSLATCIVGTVDFYTGKRYYFNLKKVSYWHFSKMVNASASLPIFTPGEEYTVAVKDFEGKTNGLKKAHLYDGGVRDHSPTPKVLESKLYKGKIKENCTIFSRPESVQDALKGQREYQKKNVMEVLSRFVEVTNTEASKNDERLELQLVKDLRIKHHGTFFLPKVLHSVYDTNPTRLKKIYQEGGKSVRDNWVA